MQRIWTSVQELFPYSNVTRHARLLLQAQSQSQQHLTERWKKIMGDGVDTENVRIGHPSGIMTMCPEVVVKDGEAEVPAVAVQRTARRIMDGNVYVRN